MKYDAVRITCDEPSQWVPNHYTLLPSYSLLSMLRCKKAYPSFVPRSAFCRNLSTSRIRKAEPFNPATVDRAEDEVDVCIVGGGPAGLSAAIRLKQLEREKGNEIRVVVLEKGSEAGMFQSAIDRIRSDI